MPSWNDGESSNESTLGDIVAMDYAPATCDDPQFHGLALGCLDECSVHKLEPQRCVAFEGSNTGRRFYMCSVQNQVMNCGFVSWLDGEWPSTIQNALSKLWGLYEKSNSALVEERFHNATLAKDLAAEKNKLEMQHSSLSVELQRNMDEGLRHVKEENAMLKGQVESLSAELCMLKNVHKAQADIMRGKQLTWDAEKDATEVENKNLQKKLSDMLK